VPVAPLTATLLLHPDVPVVVRRDEVTGNDCDVLTDLLARGQVVVARVTGYDGAGRPRLGMLDVDDDDPVAAGTGDAAERLRAVELGLLNQRVTSLEAGPADLQARRDRAEAQRLRAVQDLKSLRSRLAAVPEKAERRLVPFELGPRFLDSLQASHGVDRGKVLDVVVEVLTGIAGGLLAAWQCSGSRRRPGDCTTGARATRSSSHGVLHDDMEPEIRRRTTLV